MYVHVCVDQVILGEDGVRDNLSKGKGFVNLSTIDPETSSRMAEVRHMHTVTRYEQCCSGAPSARSRLAKLPESVTCIVCG